MSHFSVFIVQPKGWLHMQMYKEIAHSLTYALRQLGHEVDFSPGDAPEIVNPKPPHGRPIILGANFLPDCPLAPDAILYNFEQVAGKLGGGPGEVNAILSDAWLRNDYLKLLRRHTVWDYSATNIERLRRLGVESIHQCRVGYSPELSCIEPAEEDVDVLFYGTCETSPRRMKVLHALADLSYRVAPLQGVYGKERDAWIARSKIVLNIHNNEPLIAPAIWEIARCSYLLANKKCVVSEDGSEDPELDAFAKKATAYVPYDKIVETCAKLLEDSAERRRIAEQGLAEFKMIDQVREVKRVLEECR